MLQHLIGIGASIALTHYIQKSKNLNIKVLHASPGRLRLQCDRWKNANIAPVLTKQMEAHRLVERVEVSPITGSLLLLFHAPSLTPDQLDEILKLAVSSTTEGYRRAPSTVMQTMRKTLRRADQNIKVHSRGAFDLKSVVTLSVLGKVLWDTGRHKHPLAVTLLLWAYTSMDGKETPHEN
ncbi:HMA2 domain-containing protein [Paenibacillus turpanensis]|uniref:HMA2 domain-containing protein n=1 Tax=Paenibacillus turpanensis TaxID=2689078 RepID=UPI00140A1550|nr:hypothetical protein [Paenibacillus turpanensis]